MELCNFALQIATLLQIAKLIVIGAQKYQCLVLPAIKYYNQGKDEVIAQAMSDDFPAKFSCVIFVITRILSVVAMANCRFS